MAVLIQSPASLPLPSRVAAPSRPESSGLWLLTASLFLLLIAGRMTNYTAVIRNAKKRPTSSMVLPSRSFRLPTMPGALPANPAPASTSVLSELGAGAAPCGLRGAAIN